MKRKTIKRNITAILSAATLAFALAGCGSGAGTAADAPGQNTTAEASQQNQDTGAADQGTAADAPAQAADTTNQSAADTAGEVVDTITAATMPPSLETDLDEILAAVDKLVYENEDGQLTVSHKYGETVMPEDPQRIVCIKLEDLTLALGVDMVACRNFDTFYLEDEINALGIGNLSVDEEADTVNFEEVLSYQPDLIIIRDSFDQTIYDELSKIAPTIAFRLQDSRISLVAIGRALGIEETAVSRLGQYEKKIADAKEALKAVEGDQVAMLRILKKEIRLYPYSTNDMSSFLYMDLDLTPDPMVVEYDNADSMAISMETLPDLTADHIFLIAGYGSSTDEAIVEAQKQYEEMKSDPLWQMVPAVQKGQIYEVDSRVWLSHGILATERKIDDVLAVLLP